MNLNNQTIFIIDDESSVCEALRYLFESIRLNVKTYKDAHQFLKEYNNNARGCILVDVRMPIMSGLELLEQLNLLNNRLPVIVITGHADIQMTIRAMKLGAADFIVKPFNDQTLLEAVQKQTNRIIDNDSIDDINERIDELTERERQIIDLISDGKLNKEIAYELAISISTVEAHRANLMKKMRAKNLAHLIKIYYRYQWVRMPVALIKDAHYGGIVE
jgi:two-component system response regulator FixJ